MKRFFQTIVLTVLLVLFFVCPALPIPIDLPILSPADDGVERDHRFWEPDTSPLVIGRPGDGEVRDVGLRFLAPALKTTRHVLYARLRLAARGGVVPDSLRLTLRGVLEPAGLPFSQQRRPSQLSSTQHTSRLVFHQAWLDGGANQLFYYSGDISAIVNEIIEQPDWGCEGDGLILCLQDDSANRLVANYLAFSDKVPDRWPATLQVCRTLQETFVGHEIVGRPTDHSATVNFSSLVALEVFVQYGVNGLDLATETLLTSPEQGVDVLLDGLPANALCDYRLAYRLAGSDGPFEFGPMRHFHTQRPPGQEFVFTIQADSHLWESWAAANPESDYLKLYVRSIDNAAAAHPDFHFSMGDYSMTEYSQTARHARDRYLVQRPFLDRLLHSVPFFLVLGNHEGELGYFQAQGDSIPAWSEKARRAYVPNPYPDGFYSGCPDLALDGSGQRESYYSWEWGDALFVVLDPYWYTRERPFHNQDPAQGGGWAWTLGQQQYDWLYQVLQDSDRCWKIVLLHHLIGGVDHGNSAYGRGGIETVKWSVAHNPTFEWGGENSSGVSEFSQRRPGFTHGPIHDLLVQAGVSVVVTGHDHFYSWQELDGLVYMTVPQPQDRLYQFGAMAAGEYTHGTLLPNSGHVRFQVGPQQMRIQYLRSFLPGEGPNAEVADTHLLGEAPSAVPEGSSEPEKIVISPNPAGNLPSIRLETGDLLAGGAVQQLKIHDVAGRLVRVLTVQGTGPCRWDRLDERGQAVPSGVYLVSWLRSSGAVTARLVVIK